MQSSNLWPAIEIGPGICQGHFLCYNILMDLTLDTWIVSDTHFFHENIKKFCNRPDDWQAKFIDLWHEMINPEDQVLHLGDVAMGPHSQKLGAALLPSLPGNKYMLRGNHDHQTDEWYHAAGFPVVGEDSKFYMFWNNQKVLLSHYPDCKEFQWNINIHGHIHNNGYAPGTPYKDYRNVSIEVVAYRPVRLKDILEGDSYEARDGAPEWPLSQIITMQYQNKLTDTMCEREFL